MNYHRMRTIFNGNTIFNVADRKHSVVFAMYMNKVFRILHLFPMHHLVNTPIYTYPLRTSIFHRAPVSL